MLHLNQSIIPILENQEIDFKELLEKIKSASSPINAYHYATKALGQAHAQQNEKQVAKVDLLLVDILIKNGAYQEAINKNITVLEYFQKTGMATEEAKGWRYMAIIHSFLGNHVKQLEYNKRCLGILQKLDNPQEEMQILNNIGDTYFNMGLYDKAQEVFEQNLKNPKANALMVTLSTKNLGKVYFKKREFSKAKTIFKKTGILAKENDILIMSTASDHFFGRIFMEEGNHELAYEYFKRVVENFEKMGTAYKEFKYALEDMLKVLLLLGKSEKANIYLEKYFQLNNEVSKKIKNQSLSNIQFKIEINDIEKKRVQLEEQNRTLQEANEKIKSQSEALVEKSNALKAANQELSHFAHMVSHDIKQPIRTINNFTKMLEREVKDNLTDNAKEFINIIHSSSREITVFVEDVLKYATATQSNIELECVDCNEVLHQIKSNLELQLKESGGQLIYENLPTMKAHYSLMVQVFQNIISNALKFRKVDVPPIVKISGKETDQNYHFEIEDNGIGIEKEHQAKVFQLFQQLNNKSKFEGSGIGLNTVLKILKKYDGHIDLESTFGEGTTFKITIPKQESCLDD